MIEVGVVLHVEGHLPPLRPVQPHLQPPGLDLLDRAQRAVLHPHGALVAQEHDPVAGREVAPSPLGRDRLVLAELARLAHAPARQLVQLRHVRPGVRQDHPALLRRGSPLRVPALHKRCTRLLVGRMAHHHARALVGLERHLCPARRELARGVALPVLPLPPNLGDLGRPVAFRQRPEGRPGLDGLQLLGIADHDHLGARLVGRGQHPIHLARADHPGLVDDQHVARGERFPPLPPGMLQAGDGPRLDARPRLQVLRRDAGERRAAHVPAGRLPRLPRHPQHRRLARARVADRHGEITAAHHMLKSDALLLAEVQSAALGGGESTHPRRRHDLMPRPLGHRLSRPLQPRLHPQHLACGEALAAAAVLPQRHHLGRGAHRAHRTVELVLVIGVPEHEGLQVALRERRLLTRDGVQRHGRLGDDPLAVPPRDLPVLDRPLGVLAALFAQAESMGTSL